MKKTTSFFVKPIAIVLLSGFNAVAQSITNPVAKIDASTGYIDYQGKYLTSVTSLPVTLTILKGKTNPLSASIYEENQTISPNESGFFSIRIGENTPRTGVDFKSIDFSNDDYFIKCQSSGTILGVTLIISPIKQTSPVLDTNSQDTVKEVFRFNVKKCGFWRWSKKRTRNYYVNPNYPFKVQYKNADGKDCKITKLIEPENSMVVQEFNASELTSNSYELSFPKGISNTLYVIIEKANQDNMSSTITGVTPTVIGSNVNGNHKKYTLKINPVDKKTSFFVFSAIHSFGNVSSALDLVSLSFKFNYTYSTFSLAYIDINPFYNSIGKGTKSQDSAFTNNGGLSINRRIFQSFDKQRHFYGGFVFKYFNQRPYIGAQLGSIEVGGPFFSSFVNFGYMASMLPDTAKTNIPRSYNTPRNFNNNLFFEFAIRNGGKPIISELKNFQFKVLAVIPMPYISPLSFYDKLFGIDYEHQPAFSDIQLRVNVEYTIGKIRRF